MKTRTHGRILTFSFVTRKGAFSTSILRNRVSRCLGASVYFFEFGFLVLVIDCIRSGGRNGRESYGKVSIHNTTTGEVIFGKMDHGVFDGGGEVHKCFFLLDFGVGAEALGFLGFGSREFAVELLEALFAEGVDGGVFFEGGDELGRVLENCGGGLGSAERWMDGCISENVRACVILYLRAWLVGR